MREIVYLKMQEQEQGTVGGGETPALARHLLPCTSHCTLNTDTDTETTKDHMDIQLGSVYEIDHSKLPPRTPVQLRSTRVVVVSEKTELNIAVRFPSTRSLQRYLSKGITEMCPELDERFVMGTKLAEKMLFRQVRSREFTEKKNSKDFWQLISNSDCGIGDFVISNKAGSCLSELKCNGMPRWGVRRQVKFVYRHTETNEDEQEENEESEEESNGETDASKKNDKRKRCSSRLVPKGTKAKLENQSQINKTRKKSCKQIGRWSAERYKVAEKNLLEVMKAKGAVYKSPILRPELRLEARKRIGDTGLLDHLLKHMAGKVAPGGDERFRRRHNAEGVMEYWLESADLVDIRREAGVQDPYWTPPPGWKTGDCPSQDPICAKEMKELKEETSKLERDLEELVSKKQMEEEIAKLRREIEEELSKKQQQESQETVPLNPMITLEKYMEEVMGVSRYVSRIEEEIGKLKSKVREEIKSDSALMVSAESCDEKEKKKVGKPLVVAQQKEAVGTEGRGDQGKTNVTEKEAESTGAGADQKKKSTGAGEEKAAEIQRPKSGFRICKPQGTFLWPNMASPQVVVHAEDLLMVPTPPSVSSSTSSAPPQLPYHHHHHHHHYRPYPVKPLAERRALKVTVSSIGDTNFSTTTTTTTGTNKTTASLMNLNDFPSHPGDIFCGPRFSSSSLARSCLPERVGTWLALATPTSAPNDSTRG
ncbi:hypothetical protein RHMOL_Rhmol03G0189700 [Rhododendron molle]|uniref:Uncharacterized protein n=1 Tax=Rhododendron molle TaxID=49168 RepID=A0ACC0PHG2_RHOML|nr:hypothetical protein RHMOL_Rhmol03G0189700 [Rhododendron molle]